MAIRIQRLICNVTVLTSPSSSATAMPVMTSREMSSGSPTLPSTVLQRELEAGDSAVAPKEAATGNEGSAPAAVDPRKLADQVYRLMLDDLRIARERE